MTARHVRRIAVVTLFCSCFCAALAAADPVPVVDKVAAQPLAEHARQVREALAYLGVPLSEEAGAKLDAALKSEDEAARVRGVQEVFDPLCVAAIHINPESRVKVAAGPAKAELVEQGWRQFLVKIHNEAGVTAELKAASPHAARLFNAKPDAIKDLWLDMQVFNAQPLRAKLSGLEAEYRILQLYSRDAGKRTAAISFNVGQGSQDIGFRNDVSILFECLPSKALTLNVLDEDAKPTTAAFVIRDKAGRVYPSQAKRLAPDFAFHPQVYRAFGEELKLPKGEYSVEVTRGPEYLPLVKTVIMGDEPRTEEFRMKRWVDPAKLGWWSGDHHIHAAGCAHYTNPTEGVHAPDMARHCRGEDLKVGCNLTWGPCFDYQKQFFTGKLDNASAYPYLLRYDIEVSGFGSHQSGHLCLLRLKEQMYPGGDSSKHWPTLGLNTLKWAKKQGAVTGPAHSGWGLEVRDGKLPSYQVPPYNGIGANEYIVDVTHEVDLPGGRKGPAVDFISTVDTPYVWELNMWYHTLNCGFRTRASGETDFPCIYGERVGLGRSYVKLDGALDFDAWCEGIRNGRNYVGDGRSHLMEFKVGDVAVGENGSELKLAKAGPVKVTVKAAALLNEKADDALRKLPYQQKPYWHIERARVEGTRRVKVELIVNGYPVGQHEIDADGMTRDLNFEASIERSSWVALRILPSSHTNPVFVLVDNKPVRASRRSAEWCLKGVEQCWKEKARTYDADEKKDAEAAYEHARQVYRKIVEESGVE